MTIKEKPFLNIDMDIALIFCLLKHQLSDLLHLESKYLNFMKINSNFINEFEDVCNKIDNTIFLFEKIIRDLKQHTELSRFELLIDCIKHSYHNKSMKGWYFRNKYAFLKKPGDSIPSLNGKLINISAKSKSYSFNNSNNDNLNLVVSKIDTLSNKLNKNHIKNSNSFGYKNNNNYNCKKYNKFNNNNSYMNKLSIKNIDNYYPEEDIIANFMNLRKVPRAEALATLREYKQKPCWQYKSTKICKNGSNCWYKH